MMLAIFFSTVLLASPQDAPAGTLPAEAALPQTATDMDEQITTFRCRFVQGPRAGQIQDYASYSGVSPILVGSYCQDGAGSSGIGVTNRSDDLPQMPKRVDAKGTPIFPGGITWACRFDTGPRAGEVQRFIPPVIPFRVGGDCSDGGGSSGIAVE